jgi:hypothetical protein
MEKTFLKKGSFPHLFPKTFVSGASAPILLVSGYHYHGGATVPVANLL